VVLKSRKSLSIPLTEGFSVQPPMSDCGNKSVEETELFAAGLSKSPQTRIPLSWGELSGPVWPDEDSHAPSASKVDASPFRSPRGLDGAGLCVVTARPLKLM